MWICHELVTIYKAFLYLQVFTYHLFFLGIISNLKMIWSTWEDVRRLYANPAPSHVRDLGISGFRSPGGFLDPPHPPPPDTEGGKELVEWCWREKAFNSLICSISIWWVGVLMTPTIQVWWRNKDHLFESEKHLWKCEAFLFFPTQADPGLSPSESVFAPPHLFIPPLSGDAFKPLWPPWIIIFLSWSQLVPGSPGLLLQKLQRPASQGMYQAPHYRWNHTWNTANRIPGQGAQPRRPGSSPRSASSKLMTLEKTQPTWAADYSFVRYQQRGEG